MAIMTSLEKYRKDNPSLDRMFRDDHELVAGYYRTHKTKINEAGFETLDEYKQSLGLEVISEERQKRRNKLKKSIVKDTPDSVSTMDNVRRTLGPALTNLLNTAGDLANFVGAGRSSTLQTTRPSSLRGVLIRPPMSTKEITPDPEPINPETSFSDSIISNEEVFSFQEKLDTVALGRKNFKDERLISEREMLKRMMLAEARGEGIEGMAVVGRSILNRVALAKKEGINFLQKEDTIKGILTGTGQYEPMMDGSFYDYRTQDELAEAEKALRLASDPDKLEDFLEQQGVDADKIKNLLASTGFATEEASDKIQKENWTMFGNHGFTTHGNKNMSVPLTVSTTSEKTVNLRGYSSKAKELFGPEGAFNSFSEANKRMRFSAEQRQAETIAQIGSFLLGPDNVKLQKRDGILSLDSKDPTYKYGKEVADVLGIASHMVGWQKALVKAGPKLGKDQKVAKWFRANTAVLLGEQTGWDIYDETRLLNFIGDFIEDDPAKKSDIMKYLEADKDDPQLEARVSLLVEGSLLSGIGAGLFQGGKFVIKDGLAPATSAVMRRLRELRTTNSDKLTAFRRNLDAATVWGKQRLKEAGKKEPISSAKMVEDTDELLPLWQMAGMDAEEQFFKLPFTDKNLFSKDAMKRKVYETLGGRFFKSRGAFTPKLFELFNVSKQAKDAWRTNAEMLVEVMDGKLDDIARRTARGEEWLSIKGFKIRSKAQKAKQQARKEELLFQIQSAMSDTSVLMPGKKRVQKFKIEDLPKTLQPIVKELRSEQDRLSKLYTQSDYVPKEVKDKISSKLNKYLRRSFNFYEAGTMPTEKAITNAEKYFANRLRRGIFTTPAGRKTKLKVGTRSYDITIDPTNGKRSVVVDGQRKDLDTFINSNAKGQVQAIIDDIGASKELYDYMDKLSGRLKGVMKARKDVPKAIRELLGETQDPRATILTSLTRLSNAVEQDEFLKNAWELGRGKYFRTEKDNIFTKQLPDKNMGDLNGKFTTPEIFRIFEQEKRWYQNFKVYGWFLQGKGYGQAAKTVLNHITHMRNTFGGGFFMLANGMNPFSREVGGGFIDKDVRNAFNTLRSTAKDKRKGYELYTKYQSLGIVNTNAKVGDFRALIEDASEFGLEGKRFEKFKKGVTKYGLGKVQKLYIYEDDLFKIASFEKELATLKKAYGKELSQEQLEREAAAIVRNVIPNYDLVPHGIKKLRRLPIGNFFSFPAEMIRTSFNIVRQAGKEMASENIVIRNRGFKRAGGFMGAGILGSEVAGRVTQGLAGVSSEEDTAVRNLLEPDYNKYTTRTYFRGEDGSLWKNNFSFVDPYDILKEPLRIALMEYSDGKKTQEERDVILTNILNNTMQEFLAPFASEALLTEAVADVAWRQGRTSRGQPIEGWDFREGGDVWGRGWNNSLAGLAHISKTWVPGGASQINKLLKSFEAYGEGSDILPTGQELEPSAELIANFTGFRWGKVNKQYITSSLEGRVRKYANEKKANRSYFTKLITNEHNEIDFIEAYVDANLNHFRNSAELALSFDAAKTLIREERLSKDSSLTAQQIVRDFSKKSAGLNKKEQHSLFNSYGTFEPLEISDGDKERIKDNLNFKHLTPSQLFSVLNQYRYNFSVLPLIDLDATNSTSISNHKITDKGFYGKQAIERTKKFEGGEVSKEHPVSNVVEDPSERINPYTGLPYDAEAERHGMDEGGLLVSIGVAPVSKKQMNKLKNVLKTRRTKRYGGGHLIKNKLRKRLTA